MNNNGSPITLPHGCQDISGGRIEAVRLEEITCRRETLKGGSLMKRLIATLCVVLFVFSLSLSAQADSGLADLEGKLSAFMASAGATVAVLQVV